MTSIINFITSCIVTSIIAMSMIIKSFVDKDPQNTYNSFFFRVLYQDIEVWKNVKKIRLDGERNIRINTLLSYYSLREPRMDPKRVYTCDCTVCCYHFIYWRPDLHYSVFKHLWDQCVITFSIFTCTYLHVKFSIRVACSTLMEIEMNSSIYVLNFTWKLRQFVSPIAF